MAIKENYQKISKTLRLLADNAELLSSCCSNNNGSVPYNSDNFRLIEKLKEEKLAHIQDESLNVRLCSPLLRLFSYLNGVNSFYYAHGHFADLISRLSTNIEDFLNDKRRLNASIEHQNNLKAEISENAGILIDDLKMTIRQFHRLVFEEFSLSATLEEKTLKLKRCRNELEKIVEVIDNLGPAKLKDFYAGDSELEGIFMKYVNTEIQSALNEANVITEKVFERLTALNDERTGRLNNLIDGFLKQYTADPNFTPVLESFRLPEKFCFSKPLAVKSYPNLNPLTALDEDRLQKEAVKALLKHADSLNPKNTVKENTPVTDERGSRHIIVTDTISRRIDQLFEFVRSKKRTAAVSAVQSYELFKSLHEQGDDKNEFNLSADDWLFLVLQRYLTLRYELKRRHIEVTQKTVNVMPYDGNTVLLDLLFESSIQVK